MTSNPFRRCLGVLAASVILLTSIGMTPVDAASVDHSLLSAAKKKVTHKKKAATHGKIKPAPSDAVQSQPDTWRYRAQPDAGGGY